MSCLWFVHGTIKPKKSKIDQVTAILQKYCLDFGNGIEEGTFDISNGTYASDSYADDLVNALSPMLDEGELDIWSDDKETEERFAFQNGECSSSSGSAFLYYPGYEEDFVEQLPKEIVDFMTRKAFMEKRPEFITHYQDLIRRYFADQTEEGRIDKHARMEEAEYTLIHCFGMTPEEIRTIYEALYAETYHAGPRK